MTSAQLALTLLCAAMTVGFKTWLAHEDRRLGVGMVMVPRPVFRTFKPLEAFGSLDPFQLEDAWIDYPTTDTFQEFVEKVREASVEAARERMALREKLVSPPDSGYVTLCK